MSGIRTKIGQHYHINNDCTPAQMPPTVVVQSPAHGKIEIVKEKIFPKSNGPLARCGSVKVPGLAGYYTSKPGFAGKDQFTLRAPVGDGKIADTTIIVNVLK